MDDEQEFRLEVLRLVLETGSNRIIDDPLERAAKYLQWCKKEDKPDKGASNNTSASVVEISKSPRKKK